MSILPPLSVHRAAPGNPVSEDKPRAYLSSRRLPDRPSLTCMNVYLLVRHTQSYYSPHARLSIHGAHQSKRGEALTHDADSATSTRSIFFFPASGALCLTESCQSTRSAPPPCPFYLGSRGRLRYGQPGRIMPFSYIARRGAPQVSTTWMIITRPPPSSPPLFPFTDLIQP